MKLKKITLKNFRGYSYIEVPFDPNFNVLIEKNDAGKSTILEALEIFFNNNAVKLEIQDLNVWNTEKKIAIGLTFEIDKNKGYVIDSYKETKLADEYLLNSDGDLEILKVWDCSKNLTAKSLNTYIVADYWNEFTDKPLVTLTLQQLKKIVKDKDLGDLVDDERTASGHRMAIYKSEENKDKRITNIPVDKADAKAIWNSLSAELPFFALFQSDRQNKDTDKEVQDPLKLITKQAISEKEEDLLKVVEEIKAKAKEKGQKTIDKLKEMDPDVAKTLSPNVTNRNWESLFSFSFSGDEGIPLNKRGSGVRRLILLNYFRAEAEDLTRNTKGVIYAIEEPETSQHPNYQIMLINSLIELSQAENKQVIITTHSPEIAKISSSHNLILISKDKDNKHSIIANEDSKLTSIKETLGILPYLTKLVICVEGPHDIDFLRNINKIPEFKEIIDIEKEGISMIPMNGGNLKNWIDRNYLEDSNVVEFHLYDSDLGSGKNADQYKEYCEKVNAREDGSCALLTQKREMENYIPRDVIQDYFEIDCSEVENWNIEDIPNLISSKKNMKEAVVKSILNGKLSKKITMETLEELGSICEVREWFEKIREINTI